MQPTLHAALYDRISDDKTGLSQGVARQNEDCEELVQRRGWPVFDRYRDNDRSAKQAGTRPGFGRMLQEVAGGKVQVIVAWNWDRLTRNRKETVQLIETCQEHGVLIVLVRGSDIDCSTAAGRLVADVLASVARNEIDVKSERQVRAYRQQAEQGRPHYVARPYGYTRRGELVPEEAVILQDIARKYLSGWGLSEIRTWLHREGVPSATGGHWTNRVIREHLLARRNAGIRVYKGEEFPGKWTPIYDRDLHERLVAENGRRPNYLSKATHSNRRRYLLSGLLICGRCGQIMTGHRRADHAGLPKRDKYNCVGLETGLGCKGQVRVAATLEHFIREAVLFRLDSPQLAEHLAKTESHAASIEPLRNRQAALTARLETLLDDYTDGTMSKPEYRRAKSRLSAALEGVRGELSALYSSERAAAVLDPSTSLRAAWEQNPDGWRRQVIELLVERIVVHPSLKRPAYWIDGKRYKFDMASVEIVWRV